MLKLAVIGAQTLVGQELVQVLEAREASVLPLATGDLSREQEEGDLVVFAPEPSLLEGLDLVILADTPQVPTMLDAFSGRILDLRESPDPSFEPWPLVGAWPSGARGLRGRPALEQVLGLLPSLLEGIGEVAGTHLRSVACLGQRGLEGLKAQSVDILRGHDPDVSQLGYRAAFEVVPQEARGSLVEVRVPVFHGDLLILHVTAEAGRVLQSRPAPEGVRWVEAPPTSREVAVSSEVLVHLAWTSEGHRGVLTLGFDPILWGILRPTLRLLGL